MAALAMLAASSAAAGVLYSVTDLGTLDPADARANIAYAVNESLQVVGTSAHDAFLWESGGLTNLYPAGTLTGEAAYGINSSRQIVGFSQWIDPQPVLWENSSIEWLSNWLPPGSEWNLDMARDINDGGLIVGTGVKGSDKGSFVADRVSETIVTELLWSFGRAINNAGQVVGDRGVLGTAFLYDPVLGLIDLGYAGTAPVFPWSGARDINEDGQVVGYCAAFYAGNSRAFLITPEDTDGDGEPDRWFRDTNGDGQNDLMLNLGALGAPLVLQSSEAAAVNDHGHVVGWSTHPASTTGGDYHAFLWTGSEGIRDLNDLIPPGSGWLLVQANDINDAGNIVGWGYHDGARRPFLLTPGVPDVIPEPATLTLLALAGLGLVARRKRKR